MRGQPAIARSGTTRTRGGVRLGFAVALTCVLVSTFDARPTARRDQEDDAGIASLLNRLEQVILVGDVEGYLTFLAPEADRDVARSVASATFGEHDITRAVVRERDRVPVPGASPGSAFRLAVDLFVERGTHGRIVTWRLDVRRREGGSPPESRADAGPRPPNPDWVIQSQESLSGIDGLEQLTIDPATQYAAHGLTVRGEDVEFNLRDGALFVARAETGVTAIVLLGEGEMVFRPSSETERGQVRIFAGAETLRARFDAVMLRMPPDEVDSHLALDGLAREKVDGRLLSRARSVLGEEGGKTFSIDLQGLSSGQWWVPPQPRCFVAEVRTKKHGTLTYARDWNQPEDVSLFDREQRRHIAVYASPEKLKVRGASFTDGEDREYEVSRYEIEAAFTPDRQWINGQTRLRGAVRAGSVSSLTLRLADSLEVRSVISARHGRLLALRVRNQDSLVVSLPASLAQGSPLDLIVTYSGRLEPQAPEREGVQIGRESQVPQGDLPAVPIEESYLYSNRTYWYAQTPEVDYATASIRVLVPAKYTCVASGQLSSGSPMLLGVVNQKGPSDAQKIFMFDVARPARYFACVISRFTHVQAAAQDPPALAAEVTDRFKARGQRLLADAGAIARYYASLVGDSPYPTFTLALVESDLPGGHSPAYFAVLNQVIPRPGLIWRNDPAAFNDFPEYFLAHELAHQWWGQAVGTRNYHEAWISEGFAAVLRGTLRGTHARARRVPRDHQALPPLDPRQER